MFHCSADQTQWFHLYRVQKIFPTMFVLFACGEADVNGEPSMVLDLRIISAAYEMMGGSWWIKKVGGNGHHATRADLTKFLGQHAKISVAYATKRSVDDIDMVDSSHEELAMMVSYDGLLKNRFEAVEPTLFARLARKLVREVSLNQSATEFEELTDWPTRVPDESTENSTATGPLPEPTGMLVPV